MNIEKVKELAKLVDELEKLSSKIQNLSKELDKADRETKRFESKLKDSKQAFDWHDEGREYVSLSSGTYCIDHDNKNIYKIEVKTFKE